MIKDINIGFIGLGNVGSKLANSLMQGGYNLFVYDLEKMKANVLTSKGAFWCDNIESLVKKTSVIITCLPSPKSVSTVIEGKNGIIKHINKNHIWIEMSTTDENEMIRLSKLLINKGAKVLEAPVSGGQHRAETGNISVLAAGERNSFDRALPILSEIGYKILYCGKLGNASTLKVITNYLASINLIALGEALMVSKKYGIDLTRAFHGIKISSGNSFVHETESNVILSGSYDVGFTMDLVCKDLSLFDKLTKKYNIPSNISELILNIFEKGRAEFGDKSFSTSIVKKFENECKENLRAPNFPKKLIDNEKRKKGFEIKF